MLSVCEEAVRCTGRDREQRRRGNDAADNLGDDIAGNLLPAEASSDCEPDGDSRVEVSARDWAERVRRDKDAEAQSYRHSEETDVQAALPVIEASGKQSGADDTEDKDEGPHDFRGQACADRRRSWCDGSRGNSCGWDGLRHVFPMVAGCDC